jgi:hypothetical protein
MICCGYGSDFGKVMVPGSGSGSGYNSASRQKVSTFVQKRKYFTISCLLVVSKAAYLPESLPLIFDFSTFYYILCGIRIQIRFRKRNRNARKEKLFDTNLLQRLENFADLRGL